MPDNQANQQPNDIAISLIEALHKALGAEEITIVALYPSDEENVYNTSLITSMDDKRQLNGMFTQLAEEVENSAPEEEEADEETEAAIQAFKNSPGTYEDFIKNMPTKTREEFDALTGEDKAQADSMIKMLLAMNQAAKGTIH